MIYCHGEHGEINSHGDRESKATENSESNGHGELDESEASDITESCHRGSGCHRGHRGSKASGTQREELFNSINITYLEGAEIMVEDLNLITEKIIGCAIRVHKALGPGLLESVYEAAICIEFDDAGIKYDRQKLMPVIYKDREIGLFKIDLVVESKVVTELKSTERMDPIYQAKLLGYMKLGNYRLGLLINFNSRFLKDGLKRFIL